MKKAVNCLKYLMIGVCMMAAMTGCGSRERNAKAAELLEEKYGEKFVIDENRGQEPMQDYYTVIAHSEEYPTIIFSAGIGADDDSVDDTYVCERLMARMSDEMSKSMGSLKGESYIFAQGFLEYTPFDDTNISLETFMQELPDQEFTFYLNYVPEDGETAEDIYDGVSSMVSSIAAAKGNVAVYICDEKTLGKIQGYVESHDILYDSYNKIVEGKYAGKIQYAGGRPVSDKNEFLKKAGELL
jgi:hypothetical protein